MLSEMNSDTMCATPCHIILPHLPPPPLNISKHPPSSLIKVIDGVDCCDSDRTDWSDCISPFQIQNDLFYMRAFFSVCLIIFLNENLYTLSGIRFLPRHRLLRCFLWLLIYILWYRSHKFNGKWFFRN